MLNFNFYDYNEFKEIFGVQCHGNGVKSRKNKILLALMKSKEFWKGLRTAPLSVRYDGQPIEESQRELLFNSWRGIRDMNELRERCIKHMSIFRGYAQYDYDCTLRVGDGDKYEFLHPTYEVDNSGLCFDGDSRSVRYINHESDDHIYKMKAGKFFRRLVDANPFGQLLPEQVKVWLSEDFAERWQSFAQQKVCGHTLHISEDAEDFVRIYDKRNYDGDFGSCMSHDGGDQSSFYVDAVKAKAAWLENAEGKIIARCVIFTDVSDDDGNNYRLAERQYSSNGDNILKRCLIDKLIEAGEIDGYKSIGAGCGDARAWVANDGTSWSDKKFSIECYLEPDDILSYQDSFKWYDWDEHVAYNYSECGADYNLGTTDKYFDPDEGRVWSDYEDEYIYEDDAVYIDSRDDYVLYRHTEYCVNTDQRECEDDCVQLANGDWAYYGRDCEGYDGVYYCEHCEEYYLEEDMTYSELLDEMLCNDCCHDAEQEYMAQHSEDYRYDVYDMEWYDPEEYGCSDVRVLYWDYDQHRRRSGYTRRHHIRYDTSSFARYHNNWYFSNVTWHNDVKMPREKVA